MGLPNPIVAVKNGTMGWQLDGLELERDPREPLLHGLASVLDNGEVDAQGVGDQVEREPGGHAARDAERDANGDVDPS